MGCYPTGLSRTMAGHGLRLKQELTMLDFRRTLFRMAKKTDGQSASPARGVHAAATSPARRTVKRGVSRALDGGRLQRPRLDTRVIYCGDNLEPPGRMQKEEGKNDETSAVPNSSFLIPPFAFAILPLRLARQPLRQGHGRPDFRKNNFTNQLLMSVNYKTKRKTRPKKQTRPATSSASALELKEPPATYFVRNTEIPEFFGQRINKGEKLPVDSSVENNSPRLFYSHQHGEIWLGDSIEWLRGLEPSSVDLVFADPPYNIKKAEWDTFESQQEYVGVVSPLD